MTTLEQSTITVPHFKASASFDQDTNLNDLVIQNKSIYNMLSSETQAGQGFEGFPLLRIYEIIKAYNTIFTTYVSSPSSSLLTTLKVLRELIYQFSGGLLLVALPDGK